MKKVLSEILICPHCLPEESLLKLIIDEEEKDDVIEGSLICKGCGNTYRIQDGIAILTPNPNWTVDPKNKYENPKVVSSYLWSHFGDFIGDGEWLPSYLNWSLLMENVKGISLDIGCAVGRFTFEMARKSELSIGIDLSCAFIKTARELMKKGKVRFELIQEGKLTEPVEIVLNNRFNVENVDFIIADALKLPFSNSLFSSVSSLNLLDKVSVPITHIQEINRVAKKRGCQVLISDPFSWSEEVTDISNWLGGKLDGEFAGYGIENLAKILEGYGGYIKPTWEVTKIGEISWKIRNHRNHWELIKSLFIKAKR